MYKQLDCHDAAELLKNHNVVLADVRDSESYQNEHIPNAIHLSMSKLQDFCLQSDKTSPVLVYCHHGISSQSAAQHLVDQGFQDVYSLTGGYELWKKHYSSTKD